MEKISKITKKEIVTEFNHIQIQQRTYLVDEDGEQELGKPHRFVIQCGDWDLAEEHGLTELVKALWTDDLIKKYEIHLEEIG